MSGRDSEGVGVPNSAAAPVPESYPKPTLLDLRALISDIASHEGHDDVQVCVEDMIATANAALVVLDKIVGSWRGR